MSDTPFFQIGPNKCGTTSLYKLFARSGVPSLQFTGQKPKHVSTGNALKANAQVMIRDNIASGQPPLKGLQEFDAFIDMEYTTGSVQLENYKLFRELHEAYPNAKFLLNIRDRMKWLKSRASHTKGRYVRRAAARLNLTGLEILNLWLAEFDRHVEEVQRYFADKPGRLLVFDIERDPIEKLVAFAAPEFELQPRFWQQCNMGVELSSDANRCLMESLFERQGSPVARADNVVLLQKVQKIARA